MNLLDEIRKRAIGRHEQEKQEGLHDQECEFRANGHFLCHCPKRRREANGHTEPPGPLIINHPTCPRCYTEVESTGDNWECENCSVQWSYNDPDDDGEFTDDYGDLDIAAWDAARATPPPKASG